MKLSLFEERVTQLGPLLRSTTELVDAINRQAGDLGVDRIHALSQSLHLLAVAVQNAVAELAHDPDQALLTHSNSVLAARAGGPDTVSEFLSQIGAVQAAADAYVAETEAMLQGWHPNWVKTTLTHGPTGVTTSAFAMPPAVPAAIADPWRTGAGVTGLLSALRAAGG